MPNKAVLKKRQTKGRTHKLGGCKNCRRRHMKCDQVRPICGQCAATELTCDDGQQRSIYWSSDDYGKDDTLARNFLYTDRARAQMTEDLCSGLINGSVESSLDRLDEQASAQDHGTNGTFNVGPFGLFQTNAVKDSSHPTFPIQGEQNATLHANVTVNMAGEFAGGLGASSNLPSSFNNPAPVSHVPGSFPDLDFSYNVGSYLDWADLFNLDMDGSNFDFDFRPDPLNDTSGLLDHSHDAPSAGADPLLSAPAHQTLITDVENRLSESDVLAHAHLLLRDFKLSLVPYFQAMPIEVTSSWELMHLNSAIKTLADLTYMRSPRVTHACRANLFAIIGCSAQHLMATGDCQSPYPPAQMQQFVDCCGKLAKEGMQMSLLHETKAPAQAKYKDQLMAILCMIAYASVTGKQTDARAYMVDSEKLVRIRGLQKKALSRRARLLHHVYSWVRITGESTYVLQDLSSAALADKINKMIGNDSHAAAEGQEQRHTELDDFLGIQNSDQLENGPGFGAAGPEDPAQGLRDIHMEESRAWAESMYMRICGIPEVWLRLVSQTTRFANVQEIVSRHAGVIKPAVSRSIARKIDRLERMIASFGSAGGGGPAAHATAPDPFAIRSRILAALSAALHIFFSRRIRNPSSPAELEKHVTVAATALAAIEVPCTAWPAFIAGCEAEQPQHRSVLGSWLQRNARRSGIVAYHDALELMREVWRRRDAAGGEGVSWVLVAQDMRIWPMLY